MFASLKELNQDFILNRINKEIKDEKAKIFLMGCLQINPENRCNVYELLKKE